MDQDAAPEPLAHVMAYTRWQDFGVCSQLYADAITKGVSPQPLDDIFFGKIGRPRVEALYAKFCNGCPVQKLCLEDGIVHREEYGVWGGLNTAQRDVFYKFRRDYVVELTEQAVRENWLQEARILKDSHRTFVRKIRRRVEAEMAQEEFERLQARAEFVGEVLPEKSLDFGTLPQFSLRTEAS